MTYSLQNVWYNSGHMSMSKAMTSKSRKTASSKIFHPLWMSLCYLDYCILFSLCESTYRYSEYLEVTFTTFRRICILDPEAVNKQVNNYKQRKYKGRGWLTCLSPPGA